ncbi:phospholipase D-like domain-containing protein [Cupriavidus necator]|uniref:phospholipase D-like domain-containing protein n=1 Tax=Cupriavidus necator TaxID=106590 RepID=UPI00339D8337
MTKQSITTPFALSCTNRATITFPWFVQPAEYYPAPCTFKPLVNGEEAFGEVYDAIKNAQRSVDIVCWGFQPSMYFKRDGSDAVSIGQLLARKGASSDKVRVRLLCWQDDYSLAEWSENNMPGNNWATMVKPYLPDWLLARVDMIQRDYQRDFQREFDLVWYLRANLNNVTKGTSIRQIAQRFAARKLGHALGVQFPGIELATRGFSEWDRAETAFRTWLQGKDKESSARTKAMNGAVMAATPTHHQKMVLIDYELPEQAVGFVMGHNMLDTYWDRDDHSCERMHPRNGRNGLHPRQDISSRVTGPLLQYLNQNFCEAWDEATGQELGRSRAAVAAQLQLCHNGDTPVMGQLLRTQPKHARFEIEEMYMQAVNNATRFIYIENQYFRLPALAEKIKAAVQAQYARGRDPGKHGPIHLFVVTNSNDEGIGPGTVKTYRMLEALGKADAMPAVAKLERENARQADLHRQYDEAAARAKQAEQSIAGAYQYSHLGKEYVQKSLAQAQERLKQARAKQAELETEMKKSAQDVGPSPEIPGLKVHICTLVAPNSPPGNWGYVYVHSKLMIVDDVFMTLGSANINTRSMMGDSELNICHENGSVTRPLRQRLWHVHTKDMGAQGDIAKAFEAWQKIIDENARRQKTGKETPYASLVGFLRESEKRSNLD